MPDTLLIIWIAIQLCVGYNLVFPLLLLIFYSFKAKKEISLIGKKTEPADYAIIITAYQYINTLPSVVKSALNINYQNYLIYVVADNCDISTLSFPADKVILLKPENILGGNVQSHFYAIANFKRSHNRITIIDSDNIIDPEYLNQLDIYFSNGFEAVQGCRAAKNLDTTYACLDAARDIYYHFYDCKLLFNLGSSSTLSGSGMAFTTELYKECLQETNIRGAGFDKILQTLILKKNKRIAYAPNALVFDEKTSRPEELVNQRSRWINTWFKYFKFGFGIFGLGIKNLSINQLLFGLVLLRPPLFLFLLLSSIMMFINLWANPAISIIWLISFISFIVSFTIALLSSETDKRIYKSLIGIPRFIFYQLISLTKIRKANIHSVSTKHHHTSI